VIAYRDSDWPGNSEIRGVNVSRVKHCLKALIVTRDSKPLWAAPSCTDIQKFLMRFGLSDLEEVAEPKNLNNWRARRSARMKASLPSNGSTGKR